MNNSTVVKLLLLSVLGLALATSLVRAEEFSFDQGINVSKVLETARAAEPVNAAPIHAAYMGGTRYDSDCVKFTFGPTDANVSEAVWLRSQEWVEECTWTGDPRYGGGRQCWERPGYSWRERVQVTLRDRKPLLPWESDSFRVCLQGPWVDARQLSTAYDYKLQSGGNRDGSLVFAPGKKLAMKPDASGISAESFSAGLALTLKDKWASYYAGEKVTLKLTLKKDLPNWFDPTLLDLELNVPASAAYQVNFLDYAAKFSQKIEAGKKYYVKVSFQRVGKISKPDSVSAGETAHVNYKPAVFSAVAR